MIRIWLTLITACTPGTETPPPRTTGAIHLAAATTGSDLATMPYLVTVAGRSANVPAMGSVLVDSVAAGTYQVPRLAALPGNCEQTLPDSVAPPAPLSVQAGETASQVYAVRCHAAIHQRVTWRSYIGITPALYSIEPDATGLTTVADGFADGHSAISPDGSRIVFSSMDRNQVELYWIDTPAPVTVIKLGAIRTVTWDPDGRHVVWDDSTRQIHRVAVDGSTDQVIAAGREPMMSPDGARLAYVRQTDGMIHVIPIGSPDTAKAADGFVREAFPRWSPDGQRIAYLYDVAGSYPQNFQLWVMNSDGSNRRQVTAVNSNVGPGSWSPDGTMLAFAQYPGVWIVNADGTGLHMIGGDSSASVADVEWVWLR